MIMKKRKRYWMIGICIMAFLFSTGCASLQNQERRQKEQVQNAESETENEPSGKVMEEGGSAETEANEEGSWLAYDYWSEWTGSHATYDLPYADEETFDIIREAYGKVAFLGVFAKGDMDVYSDYKRVFLKLLKNDMPFYNPETKEEIYLGDFEGLKLYDESTGYHTSYDVQKYKYIFFDMDEDGSPELGIRNPDNHNAVYIFRYDAEMGRCLLWYEMSNYNYSIFGSRKVSWDWDGKYLVFYQLNEDGEVECETMGTSNWKNLEVSQHTVMLPQYADKEKEIPVTDEMKAQGIFERSTGRWFFRVTEAQYDELMEPYWEAYYLAEQERKKVTYTYKELFGDTEL